MNKLTDDQLDYLKVLTTLTPPNNVKHLWELISEAIEQEREVNAGWAIKMKPLMGLHYEQVEYYFNKKFKTYGNR